MSALAAPARGLIDPVCRMTLTYGNIRNVRMVNGQAVYFCSPDCARKFDPNPERYLAHTVQHVKLPLYGLLRNYEAVNLESQLYHVPGVPDLTVDPVTDVVDVTFDDSLATVESLAEAIEQAGFRLR